MSTTSLRYFTTGKIFDNYSLEIVSLDLLNALDTCWLKLCSLVTNGDIPKYYRCSYI